MFFIQKPHGLCGTTVSDIFLSSSSSQYVTSSSRLITQRIIFYLNIHELLCTPQTHAVLLIPTSFCPYKSKTKSDQGIFSEPLHPNHDIVVFCFYLILLQEDYFHSSPNVYCHTHQNPPILQLSQPKRA